MAEIDLERSIMSEKVTRGIKVEVWSEYLPQASSPQRSYYVFGYHVTITNDGTERVQLISRHWVISDAMGHTREVQGLGVVGYQPQLEPGESFTYSSWCPLSTSFGSMQGVYQMEAEGGASFAVEIPPFTLAEPYAIN